MSNVLWSQVRAAKCRGTMGERSITKIGAPEGGCDFELCASFWGEIFGIQKGSWQEHWECPNPLTRPRRPLVNSGTGTPGKMVGSQPAAGLTPWSWHPPPWPALETFNRFYGWGEGQVPGNPLDQSATELHVKELSNKSCSCDSITSQSCQFENQLKIWISEHLFRN